MKKVYTGTYIIKYCIRIEKNKEDGTGNTQVSLYKENRVPYKYSVPIVIQEKVT